MRPVITQACVFFVSLSLFADTTPSLVLAQESPVEQGRVQWSRDLDSAQQKSSNDAKPMLVLFQEIPGCQTCQNFGNGPLSHPLLVEAMETEFHPVLVYNNRPVDAPLLKRFQEPSWNNPVVRYLNHEGEDLIQRKDRIWTTSGMAQRMVAALKAAKRQVPDYLQSVVAASGDTETAIFAMHCYWEGEAKLGSLKGVVATRSAWLDGREVVVVTFKPEVLDYSRLVREAQQFECASRVYATTEAQFKIASSEVRDRAVRIKDPSQLRPAKDSDQKYYLQQTSLKDLKLTEYQATKLNALAKTNRGRVDLSLLSPRQKRTLDPR